MSTQDQFWSEAAASYEKEFVDPYQPDVRHNPLKHLVRRLADPRSVAADLGCGIGPLLPLLARSFLKVYAVDFAEGMLARARKRVARRSNVDFVRSDLTRLPTFDEPWDVALAVNSLVMPSVVDLETSLRGIHDRLRPGGYFLGIVPAMDAVHYHTMLLLDRALAGGLPLEAARKNAAHHGDFDCYDFALGQFSSGGLEQHFWQPFEVRHRFGRAGLRLLRLKKVLLSWRQFAGGKDLKTFAPPWDWFFLAQRPA